MLTYKTYCLKSRRKRQTVNFAPVLYQILLQSDSNFKSRMYIDVQLYNHNAK